MHGERRTQAPMRPNGCRKHGTTVIRVVILNDYSDGPSRVTSTPSTRPTTVCLLAVSRTAGRYGGRGRVAARSRPLANCFRPLL